MATLHPLASSQVEELRVQIFTPKGVVWEGKARAVSSVNSQGPFDLLPEHAHFISLIEHQPITVLMGNGARTFTYKTAVIRLLDDNVTIYADIS
jgi:F0F1-type ATP synthase epsilon subunit